MVTLLTLILVLGILAVALYFWQKPVKGRKLAPFETEPSAFPPSDSRGLFGVTEVGQIEAAQSAELGVAVDGLIARAKNDDKTTLEAANKPGNEKLYDEVLNRLVEQANSEAKLLSLVSYVVGHELPVNKALAEAIIESWSQAPDRASTAKMLHIAALSDDVYTYHSAVETALQHWRDGRLSSISPIELGSLFDGEFWVLSSGARRTGAGFMLKRALARARRELETAARVNK